MRALLTVGLLASLGCAPGAPVEPPARGVHREALSARSSMAEARNYPAAAFLSDGRLLVAGGSTDGGNVGTRNTEVYDPVTGAWSAGPKLNSARMYNTVTRLADGRLVTIGGVPNNGLLPLNTWELLDADAGTWVQWQGPDAGAARYLHDVLRMPDGRLLVIGGANGPSALIGSVFFLDPVSQVWTQAASLSSPRIEHTAAVLPDGGLMVVGGASLTGMVSDAEVASADAGQWVETAYFYPGGQATITVRANGLPLVVGGHWPSMFTLNQAMQPGVGSPIPWTQVATLAVPRTFHSAHLLPSGAVLIAGGTPTIPVTGATGYLELLAPAAGAFADGGRLIDARMSHGGAVLFNGDVLLYGGSTGTVLLASAERLRFSTLAVTPTTNQPGPRSLSAVATLPAGQVLVAGGNDAAAILARADLYDESSVLGWSSLPPLTQARAQATATVLTTGDVLVFGGKGPNGVLASAELFDHTVHTWTSLPSATNARVGHTATLLDTGRVLMTGGPSASAELFARDLGAWLPAQPMAIARSFHAATRLRDGRVLVTGGQVLGVPASSCELYTPATDSWAAAPPMSVARHGHQTTVLADGRVLVTGGIATTANSEIFDPSTGTWSPAPKLASPRTGHAAVLLPTGRVLIAGGETVASGAVELIDPLPNGVGEAVAAPAVRQGAAVALLPTGRVLFTGGNDTTSAFPPTGWVLEETASPLASRVPVVNFPSVQASAGARLVVTGSGLTEATEAGGGSSTSVSSNAPVAWLMGEGQFSFGRVESFDAGQLQLVVGQVPSGQYQLRVSVNGVNSRGASVGVVNPATLTPRGSSCVSAAQCETGFCTGSVCCESACTGSCNTCRASAGAPFEGTCGPTPICLSTDGGPLPDGGTADGGPVDDGGSVGDGGSPGDGGMQSDGGVEVPGRYGIACSCGSGSGGGLAVLALLFAAGARRRLVRARPL